MVFILKEDRPGTPLKFTTPASTAINPGYPLKVASNAFAVATAAARVWAIAQGTKSASDSATTAIEGTKVRRSEIYIADVGTGTMANSYVGSTCDLKSGATHTIDLGTDIAHDVLIVGWDGVDTTKAYVTFLLAAF